VPSASDLLKSAGLLPDGPVPWGAPVRSNRPGVFLVELLAPTPPPPPIDVSICGKWAERVPTLLVDGARPDGKILQRRLAAFWLPSQTVLYVASTSKSLNARVGALYANELGSRRPHSGGHWLKTLRVLEQVRIWWSEIDAVEEAEDAVLTAFAGGVPPTEAEALHDPTVVLPWATLQATTGERKETGITGSLLAGEEKPASAIRRSASIVPAGSRAGTARAGAAAGGSAVRRSSAAYTPSSTPAVRRTPPPKARQEPPRAEPTKLTAGGLDRLETELAELQGVKRPANVARIKAARELGDLRENADYQEARREQSFIEGRVQAIEALLRNAVVVDEAAGHEVVVGSTVVLDHDGETVEYAIVGSSEASPAAGRISYVSPLGSTLLGRRAGDDIVVRTPSGERHYRLREVR
jgi:transcription elongation factor GreA